MAALMAEHLAAYSAVYSVASTDAKWVAEREEMWAAHSVARSAECSAASMVVMWVAQKDVSTAVL